MGQRLPDILELPVLLACELAGYQRAARDALEAKYAPKPRPDTEFDVEAIFKQAWEGAAT